jgi:hypothetical protein
MLYPLSYEGVRVNFAASRFVAPPHELVLRVLLVEITTPPHCPDL